MLVRRRGPPPAPDFVAVQTESEAEPIQRISAEPCDVVLTRKSDQIHKIDLLDLSFEGWEADPAKEARMSQPTLAVGSAQIAKTGGAAVFPALDITPGLLLTAMIAATAYALRGLPGTGTFSPMILAILVGILFHNVIGTSLRAKAGVAFSLRRILKRIDPSRLVFIDETWTKTNMTRTHGWAPRGERLVDKVPHGHWKTTTFLAGLRHDHIAAPCLFDGPINGERFRAYVEQFLVPTLQEGDIVIMDTLARTRERPSAAPSVMAGAKLILLPKYSPDLNPIEQVFAKLKELLRKAAARTVETVTVAIGHLLELFSPQECANYFRNAGYAFA
jgi:transposase